MNEKILTLISLVAITIGSTVYSSAAEMKRRYNTIIKRLLILCIVELIICLLLTEFILLEK